MNGTQKRPARQVPRAWNTRWAAKRKTRPSTNACDSRLANRNSDCLVGHPVRHTRSPEEVGDWAPKGTKREQNKRAAEFYKDDALYLNYLEAVAFHRPAFFLMENVKGLLSAKKADDAEQGSVFRDILEGLSKPADTLGTLGVGEDDRGHNLVPVEYKLMAPSDELFDYSLSSPSPSDFVINAKDFGVPQSRERSLHPRHQGRCRYQKF